MRECISLLSNVTLQETTTNVWQWHPNVVDGYTCNALISILLFLVALNILFEF